jgi:DNA-binding transcriptional regulator GbsR (MarR family)
MAKEPHHKKTEFAEEFGIFFEKMGFPRMAGRIWGWLLVCNPPEQTAAQIAEAVNASRGSVSTMSRLLMQLWLIERVGRPGVRSGLYRIKAGGFTEVLRMKMQFTGELRKIAERGLAVIGSQPAEIRHRLEEYRDLCVFFEREFPALIAKWERERKRKGK